MTKSNEPVTAVMPVPAAIERAMQRSATHYYRALNLPLDTYADQALRAARLATACAERARCWSGLARWACCPNSGVPWVLVSAVTSAHRREDDAARFWRDTANYWGRAAAGADPRDLDLEDLGLSDAGRWAS